MISSIKCKTICEPIIFKFHPVIVKLICQPLLISGVFTLYTMYCFDVSKHEMTVGSNTVTCDLHIHFKKPTQDKLRVYIAWFNDRTLELHTDGKPLAIRREIENYVSMS